MAEFYILYTDEVQGAAEATTVTASQKQSFSWPQGMLSSGNALPQMATFEDDYWVLGGDFGLFKDSPDNISGYFGNQLCPGNGVFDTPVTVTLSLSDRFSGADYTFFFDRYGPTWPTQFTMAFYRSNTLLRSVTCEPEGPEFSVNAPVEGFDRIVLTFYSMSHGGRFLKIESFTYAAQIRLGSGEIRDVNLFAECDLVSDTLPVSTMELKLDRREETEYIFQRNQRLRVFFGEQTLGDYYVESVQKRRKMYELKAQNIIGVLENEKFDGGTFNATSAANLLAMIGASGAVLDADIADTAVSGYLPPVSKREALRQLSFALGAAVLPIPSGLLISREAITLTSSIGAARVYDEPVLERYTPITEMRLTAYGFSLQSESNELFKGRLNLLEERRVELSEPHDMSSITVQGAELIGLTNNSFTLRGGGQIATVTARPYKRSESVYACNNPAHTLGEPENVIAYEGMTLVSVPNETGSTAFGELFDRLYSHALRNETVEAKFVVNGEKIGDRVQIYTDDGARIGHILSLDYTISGKLAAGAKILLEPEENEE